MTIRRMKIYDLPAIDPTFARFQAEQTLESFPQLREIYDDLYINTLLERLNITNFLLFMLVCGRTVSRTFLVRTPEGSRRFEDLKRLLVSTATNCEYTLLQGYKQLGPRSLWQRGPTDDGCSNIQPEAREQRASSGVHGA